MDESEPLAQRLELHVALPDQLVTRFRIIGAAQVSSKTRHKSHRIPEG